MSNDRYDGMIYKPSKMQIAADALIDAAIEYAKARSGKEQLTTWEVDHIRAKCYDDLLPAVPIAESLWRVVYDPVVDGMHATCICPDASQGHGGGRVNDHTIECLAFTREQAIQEAFFVLSQDGLLARQAM